MRSKFLLGYSLIIFGVYSSFAQTDTEKNQPLPTLIELLQNGENYAIEITSVGCFGGTRQTITITKDAEGIIAQLQENTIELTDADVQLFIAFERQLRELRPGGCSTVDTYVLRYQGQSFRTSDGTCSWHGYRQIINIFA